MSTIAALIAVEQLPPAYTGTVSRTWAPLADHLANLRHTCAHPLLIGINGVQGSGKSTACRFLEALLADRGLAAATLSLDDLYLTRAERAGLAASVHPLFATRGPPGTHDLALGQAVITQALAGTGPVALPRFDKATDDRAPPSRWPTIAAPLDILLFEGWCIGATPQPESSLAAPVNTLEAVEDPDLAWRTHVNTALATGYAALFARLDRLVVLQAPDWSVVRGWRALQEARLRARTGAGMAPATLDRFLQHYERLTRHMLATIADTADIIVPVDAGHDTGAPRFRDRAGETADQLLK